MRVGIVAPESWIKWRWVEIACRRLGHEARRAVSIDGLEAVDRWADVVLFAHKAAGCGRRNLIEAPKRSIWAQWWFDLIALEPSLPLEREGLFSSFSDLMRKMDFVFVKERSLLAEYAELGVNAYWMPQGCPREISACEHHESPEFDVLIWGSFDWKQRRKDARALADAGFRVAWAGNGGSYPAPPGVHALPFTPPMELPALASRAACVLSCDLRSDIDGYWSDRLELAAGMGAFILRRWSPGLPGYVTYAYHGESDLIGLASSLSSKPATRAACGDAARGQIMKWHTYESRLKEVLRACSSTKQIRTEGERDVPEVQGQQETQERPSVSAM